jgi:hypothetical protein
MKPTGLAFTRKAAHKLARTINALEKEVPEAIKMLSKLMESKDEKIALEACKTLLRTFAEMEDQKSKDEITRLVAEGKFGDGSKRLVPDDEDNTPYICFDTIQDVS